MSFSQTLERNSFIAHYLNATLASFSLQGKEFHCISLHDEIGQELSSLVEFEEQAITLELLEHLESLPVQKVSFRIQPTMKVIDSSVLKLLLLHKYHVQLSFTSLIDLTNNETKLWSNVRKSYKSLINKELKKVETKFYTNASRDLYLFNDWMTLYSKAISRGNKALSDNAITIMDNTIKNNMGFLVLAYDNDQLLGGMLFNYHDNLAYYSAAANCDDIESDKERYIGHLLMWKGIKKLKSLESNELEIGPLDFENQLHSHHDTKLLNITNFKLGFGGSVVPVYNFTKIIQSTQEDACTTV